MIWINHWDEDFDKLPDMVIVLNRGILIRNSGELLPKEEKSIIYLEEGDKSKCLKLLFLKLTEIAGTFSNVMVNWNDYC